MKTIKIIDLLNKIANGEKIPKKLKGNNHTYTGIGDLHYQLCNYQDEDGDILFSDDYDWCNQRFLNQEAEIIEEETDGFNGIRYFKDGNCYMSISSEPLITKKEKEIEKLNRKTFHKKQRQLASKINEVIDAVNELRKEN